LDGDTPAANSRRHRKQGQAALGRTAMDQTVEKTVDRLSELLDRANKAAQDFEVKDRLSDAVAALRRTRLTQEDDSGAERFVTGGTGRPLVTGSASAQERAVAAAG